MIDQDKMRALAAMLRKYRGHGFVVDDAQDAADAIDLLLAEVEQNRIDQLEAHGEFELMTLANKRLSEDFALADSTIESKNRNIEEIVAHNNQLRAELEAAAADKRDAERWRAVRATLSGAVGAGIEMNDERLVYQEPVPGEEVRIFWYPHTPVGFCEVHGSTLDGAADELIAQRQGE
ncbi:hypothetical protein [Burkholderia orbicola]|uniref:hypothetical protein n=1 Tax=Burkholderia orbicola TaxID=2978683 RepID=UPI002FDFD6BF